MVSCWDCSRRGVVFDAIVLLKIRSLPHKDVVTAECSAVLTCRSIAYGLKGSQSPPTLHCSWSTVGSLKLTSTECVHWSHTTWHISPSTKPP